jgi:hypothetical protein
MFSVFNHNMYLFAHFIVLFLILCGFIFIYFYVLCLNLNLGLSIHHLCSLLSSS